MGYLSEIGLLVISRESACHCLDITVVLVKRYTFVGFWGVTGDCVILIVFDRFKLHFDSRMI